MKNGKTTQLGIMKKHKGDQDWITEMLGGSKKWWSYEWAMSYKWEVLNGGLERLGTTNYKGKETKVSPRYKCISVSENQPEDVTEPIVVNNWK